jgi:hypothetical protein
MLGIAGVTALERGVQEMNEQTSNTLEVGNSIIHNVIETGNVGLQSIRLPMTLHIQPKYCIPGLCQPDTRPCKMETHNLLSTSWGSNELESPVIKHWEAKRKLHPKKIHVLLLVHPNAGLKNPSFFLVWASKFFCFFFCSISLGFFFFLIKKKITFH